MGLVRTIQRHVKVARELPGGGVGSWTLLPMMEGEGCSLGLVKELYETPVEVAGPERGRMVTEGTRVRGMLRTILSRFSAGTLLDMIFKRVSGDLEGYRVAQVSPVETVVCSGVKVGKAKIKGSGFGVQGSGTATATSGARRATGAAEIVVEMELAGLGQELGSGSSSESGYAAEGGYALSFAQFLVNGQAPGTVKGFEIVVDNGLARGPFGPDGKPLWLIAGRRSVRVEVILGYESGAHSEALVNGQRGVFRVILGRPTGFPQTRATIELPAAVVIAAPVAAGPGEAARQRVALAADVDEGGVDVVWGVA